MMKKLILSFFILMATSGVLRADAVTFEATVNSSRVSLDQVLQLTLTVTGVNGNLDPVSLPVLDGFTAKYLGPSTSVSIVNGDYHSERSFVYNLFPNKTGHFQIPPISATIIGQTYSTKPIDVEVIENSAQAQSPSPSSNEASDQNQAPSTQSLKDKILVKVSVDNTAVFLNERIPLTVKLFVNDVPMRDIQYPLFNKTGFLVDDFEKPEQSSQVINGGRYDVVVFKTNIYPARLGDLTFGPVQIQGNVLYKTGQNSPFNQDNNFFGTDVFNNFFNAYATRPVTVSSEPVQLHVSSLPEVNRPQDFSGAIGQFDFKASISPAQVKAGDPITLKMDLKGSGNFKGTQMPVFQDLGFKTYAPQIKEGIDEKTAEEVIIPTSANIKEVPALRFSYFDTSLKDYKTITQGPFAIQVAAPGPDQQFKAVGFSDVGKEISAPPVNQISLGKILIKARQLLKKLFASIWFWVSLEFIIAAGIFYFLWKRFRDRLENDPAFARRLKAVKEARQALSQAEGYISKGSSKDFYALLSKVLRDYLANKWHQPSAALSVDEILRQLKTAKLDDAHIARLKTILEQSDLVCFAGASRDAGQMRADLSQAKDLITHLEKSLK
ncbi:MAG: protein BatD [Candidatus Omnitrophica bacterium]|nr:protein BatD [Candidatus Omnitrophota bacterium]